MKKIQNFVRTFGEESEESLSESVQIPCIVLFYPYSLRNKIYVNYCHFDERNFEELKNFVKTSKEKGTNKIALFGGYGSKNTVPLLKLFRENGLVKLVDKDFVSCPPVKNLGFDAKGIVLRNTNESDTFYLFRNLKDLFY